MNPLRSALNRAPWLKRQCKLLYETLGGSRLTSKDYVELADVAVCEASASLRDSWQSDEIPARQRTLVDRQLEDFRQKKPVDVFDTLVAAVIDLGEPGQNLSLLDIGCSSGFYSEVLSIAAPHIDYSGCDYSEAFIQLAEQHYPDTDFRVADATTLPFADNSFDIAVSGCCLLHIPDYEKAVTETARVAKRYAVFHRTPVVLGQANKYFQKLAYGVQTMEIHFNEPQFLDLLASNGLQLIATHTLNEALERTNPPYGSACRTYVCRKKLYA